MAFASTLRVMHDKSIFLIPCCFGSGDNVDGDGNASPLKNIKNMKILGRKSKHHKKDMGSDARVSDKMQCWRIHPHPETGIWHNW
jgi:hypothetical protein